jgi:hypothetical protein
MPNTSRTNPPNGIATRTPPNTASADRSRTVATLIDKEADTKTAASQLGHGNEQVTDTYYIAKPVLAPDVSTILEQLGADHRVRGRTG